MAPLLRTNENRDKRPIEQVAVVTGAASGLGRALATALFQQGWQLALMDIDHNGLEKLRATLSGHQKVSIHAVDIAFEERVISARLDILLEHRQVNLLINNAGVSISQSFNQMQQADFSRLFDVNFWGTVYSTRHFLPDLQQQPGGKLVNIISGFALMGFPGKTAYGSSKSAVMGFTNSLRTEIAGTGVKISLVIPPPLTTGLVTHGKHTDEVKRKNEERFIARQSLPLDQTAWKIIAKVKKGRSRIVIGPMMFWTDFAARLSPTAFHWLTGRMKKKFDFI